ESAAPRPAEMARALLDTLDKFDFLEAKLLVDRLIDPRTDTDRIRDEIDGMVANINKMLATIPAEEASTSLGKLTTLRAFLYRSGWWNGETPFNYDMDDPFGQNPAHVLLTNYLAS